MAAKHVVESYNSVMKIQQMEGGQFNHETLVERTNVDWVFSSANAV